MWLNLDGIAEEWGFSPTFAPHRPIHRNVYVIALSQSTRVLLGNDFCMECYIPRSSRSSFSAQCRHSSPLDVERGQQAFYVLCFRGALPPIHVRAPLRSNLPLILFPVHWHAVGEMRQFNRVAVRGNRSQCGQLVSPGPSPSPPIVPPPANYKYPPPLSRTIITRA